MNEPQWMSWISEVRNRLENPPGRRLGPNDLRQAAVLVPLYVDARELWTILTRRSDSMPSHQGQIAFPGGSTEPGEEPWDAALRETEEEIGLARARVLRLGTLDEAETESGFRIVPCVGAVAHPVETRPNPAELDEVFPVPLTAFTDQKIVEDRAVVVDGQERWSRVYHIGGRQVWGLTARIIHNLLVRLGLAADDLPN